MENSSKNNVDDIFKKTFEGFENEPSDRVWGNVKDSLKTKVRRGFYASFAGALLLLGVGGLLTYSIINNGSVSQVADKGTVVLPAESSPAVASQSSVVNNNITAPAAQAANTLNAAQPSIVPVENNNNNNVQNNVRPAVRRNARNTTVTAEPVVLVEDRSGAPNNITEAGKNTDISETQDIAVVTGEKVATDGEKADNSNENADQAEADENSRKAAQDNEILKKKDADAGSVYKPKDAPVKAKMRRAPFTNPDKSGFAVIAYYAPEVSYRTISPGKNPNLENMVEVRNKFEKAAYAYSYGVKMEYQFKRHVAIQVGVAYAERGEAANYDFNGATSVQAGPFGQNVEVKYNSANIAKSTYNKYKYIEVPITATYWLGKGRSLFAVSGGISVGDLVGADILLVGQFDNEHMLLNKARYEDLRQTNFSALAGFSYSYKLNPAFSIMLDPVLRYSLTGPNHVVQLKEHQYSAGINVGLRYKITSKN